SLMLTEKLFTLLRGALGVLGEEIVQRPRAWVAAACGATLALAALTRSVLWPLPVVLCPLLVMCMRGSYSSRLGLAALLFVVYASVLAPWAVRNTRLQGVVTIVDTMGG